MTFEEHEIVTFAGTGAGSILEGFAKLMMEGRDLRQLINEAFLLRGMSPEQRVYPDRVSAFLIVTTANVYKVIIERNKPEVKKYELTDTVVAGSGSAAALLSIRLLNFNAIDAVKAAMIADEYTGGDITYVKCAEEGKKMLEAEAGVNVYPMVHDWELESKKTTLVELKTKIKRRRS